MIRRFRLRRGRFVMSKRAIKLKKIACRRFAPFDQCLKLDVTNLAFLRRSRQACGKQCIHLGFDGIAFALPM
jgi:hypothetical protein